MKSSLRLAIIVGVALVISVPSWADIINVCYNTRSGDMRYVDSPSDCRRNENSLSLNTEGQAGLDGISCWDLDSSGDCNGDEDKDGSGACDALDCQGPEGPPGGFDVNKLYIVTCENSIDCQCEDRGGRHFISGTVVCAKDDSTNTEASLYLTNYFETSETFEAVCTHAQLEPVIQSYSTPLSIKLICYDNNSE